MEIVNIRVRGSGKYPEVCFAEPDPVVHVLSTLLTLPRASGRILTPCGAITLALAAEHIVCLSRFSPLTLSKKTKTVSHLSKGAIKNQGIYILLFF